VYGRIGIYTLYRQPYEIFSIGVGLRNEVRPYKIPLVGYFWGEYLLITNSLPFSLARRRNRVQDKKSYGNNW